MNKIQLKITSKAFSDLEIIADFIAKDNKTAAKELIQNFHENFNLICEHPKIGRTLKNFIDKKIRFLTVRKHYLIIYKQIDKSIVILRVLGSYQDICDKL